MLLACLIYVALLIVSPANVPTLTGALVHSSCYTSVNALIECPIAGGGTLTISGTNFYGSVITVSPATVCSSSPTVTANGLFNQITCTLHSGAASSTSGDISVSNNAGPSTTTGLSITWGN